MLAIFATKSSIKYDQHKLYETSFLAAAISAKHRGSFCYASTMLLAFMFGSLAYTLVSTITDAFNHDNRWQ